MSCCSGTEVLPPVEQFGVLSSTPCTAITVDMLSVYRRNIQCYLTYGLWEKISSSEVELNAAKNYLDQFIERKQLDENDCTGIESLYLVRMLVDRIIKLGACL